ncbi:uncharacterized protein LOC143808540 [Ranitomeya variabilis]|uniref:uncharacterized protein LOC143808540 n=1 Tax=Ranitomeya variabilis TaxID=490064 RepID=UPI0040571972
MGQQPKESHQSYLPQIQSSRHTEISRETRWQQSWSQMKPRDYGAEHHTGSSIMYGEGEAGQGGGHSGPESAFMKCKRLKRSWSAGFLEKWHFTGGLRAPLKGQLHYKALVFLHIQL